MEWTEPTPPPGMVPDRDLLSPDPGNPPLGQPWPPEVGLVPHNGVFLDLANPALEKAPTSSGFKSGFLRTYDGGMGDWIKFWSSSPAFSVPIVMAVPGTAFSQYALYLKQLEAAGKVNLADFSCTPVEPLSFPLPMISYSSLGYEHGQGRVFPPIRLTSYLNPGRTRASWTRHPNPVTIKYQIDLWTRRRAELVWLMHRLETQFYGDAAYWYVTDPWGRKIYAPIHSTGGDDQSVRERDESEDALHRYVVSVKVDGWAFHDQMVAPTVLKATQEIRIPYTSESLEPSDLLDSASVYAPGHDPVAGLFDGQVPDSP